MHRTSQAIGMYENTTTWNPFKGCLFDCTYCKPSFQRQAKRQRQNCMDCYRYVPHYHPERLKSIPSNEIIFVCGNGDICFADPDYTRKILARIVEHNKRCSHKTYYFQSKRPEYFKQFVGEFPDNVIVVTTLETNRDKGYHKISKAPAPSERYRQFWALDYPRKVVTVEPVLDFDKAIFADWICSLKPEYVWLGFNSKPGSVTLPEPTTDKFWALHDSLIDSGLEVKLKAAR